MNNTSLHGELIEKIVRQTILNQSHLYRNHQQYQQQQTRQHGDLMIPVYDINNQGGSLHSGAMMILTPQQHASQIGQKHHHQQRFAPTASSLSVANEAFYSFKHHQPQSNYALGQPSMHIATVSQQQPSLFNPGSDAAAAATTQGVDLTAGTSGGNLRGLMSDVEQLITDIRKMLNLEKVLFITTEEHEPIARELIDACNTLSEALETPLSNRAHLQTHIQGILSDRFSGRGGTSKRYTPYKSSARGSTRSNAPLRRTDSFSDAGGRTCGRPNEKELMTLFEGDGTVDDDEKKKCGSQRRAQKKN